VYLFYYTGADYGAQFIFNVEAYEHVKDFVSGVGVKASRTLNKPKCLVRHLLALKLSLSYHVI